MSNMGYDSFVENISSPLKIQIDSFPALPRGVPHGAGQDQDRSLLEQGGNSITKNSLIWASILPEFQPYR